MSELEMKPPAPEVERLLKLPGRIFSLPSCGIPYRADEISLEAKELNGELQVKSMSMLDEIKMKSADLLYSGKAIEEVFRSCVPGIKNPLDLAQQDIDAVLCFLRIATYGPIMTISSEHTCQHAKLHTYEVNLESIVIDSAHEKLSREKWELLYTTTMPNGQVIKLKPVNFRDVISVIHSQQVAAKAEEGGAIDMSLHAREIYLKNMIAVISAIDGSSDVDMINDWIQTCSPAYARQIMSAAAEANSWGLDLKPKLKCRDCGEVYEYELPLNPVSFFSE